MNETTTGAPKPQVFKVGDAVRVGDGEGTVLAVHPEHGVKVQHEYTSVWHSSREREARMKPRTARSGVVDMLLGFALAVTMVALAWAITYGPLGGSR